ncbi:MAG: flagellin [Chloroflexota bacterium]
MPALTAQRNLNATQGAFHRSVTRLSSGLRINSAADDAAGLYLSEKLRSRVRGLQQASRNAQDGISLIQTAEGALQTVNDILVRKKELAVQSANGIYSAPDRAIMDREYQELSLELTRISDVTSFNGTKLLDGSFSLGTNLQVGDFASVDNQVALSGLADMDATALGVNGNILTVAAAQTELTAIDNNLGAGAIQVVSDRRAQLGAQQNRLEYTITTIGVSVENQTAAESRIRDADVAAEVSNMVKAQIMSQSAMAVLAQSNAAPQSLLSLLN